MADVSLHGVAKSFGPVDILHNIDLRVEDGEFVVFVGPSGCGKSTLLRIIAGLETVSAGEIRIGGRRVNELPPADRKIAMVFQSYALYPHMTVYKNMAFGLKFARTDRAEVDRRVRQAAEILKLTPYLDRKPRELSGGQRQRVAIGRAIVRKPSVFLFDEPLSNLDAALRVNTRLEIAKLHRELGATMIYVTHDQVEAMTLASKIVVLNHGRIEQVGTPLDLYRHPRNLFVAGFIGSPRMNFIKGTVRAVEGRRALVSFAGVQAEVDGVVEGLAAGASVTAGIRPEHLAGQQSGALSLTGRIDAVERLGDATYVYMKLASGEDVVSRAPGDVNAEPGEVFMAAFAPQAIHVFDADGRSIRAEAC
ncbi:ABC transporter ATP-binding protein [Microvirga thermotolerans]|uniref:sn-glycerol-3-phosphate ABC transporter ATP-binding protein UgpC n=1 Tax=Microvirga thermotolerans TaxID=2651334 RepID=A0A5P9K5E1_9HYPH|nr:sn-glycerol-3-phosphate ABC transporter ATP-binding protein UgpC [Microvirga thermotolerans]QFU17744.1 sn-glycerol-3-phosphate ABC transporter ATP-binding protein UgpC [Microvirga thermotolerans]